MLSCTFTKRATMSAVSSPFSGAVKLDLLLTVFSRSAISPSWRKLAI
jgi:hypothetical protein